MVFVRNHPFSCCLLPFPAETSPRHHAQTHKPCLEQNAIPADYIDVCPRVEKCRHNILFLHLSGQRQCGLFALRHCRHISGIFETEMANPASSRSLQLGSASRASSSATIFSCPKRTTQSSGVLPSKDRVRLLVQEQSYG